MNIARSTSLSGQALPAQGMRLAMIRLTATRIIATHASSRRPEGQR
jgi:hypothetical protein